MKKFLTGIVSFLFPRIIYKYAVNILSNPQQIKLREHELEVLETAKISIYKYKTFDIRCYEWPAGEEKVMLVHGWEGQAGNFAEIIEKLTGLNYTVFAFDGPSHGFSSKGETSMLEFYGLTAELLRHTGARKVISHSFGGVAVTYAMFLNRDLTLDKYVLLTVPDTFRQRIDEVMNQTGISSRVKAMIMRDMEQQLGMAVDELSVRKFVPVINVGKALINHDKNDRVIPVQRSRDVASGWPQATLVEVEGTGHFRILRTPAVISLVMDFIGG